MYPFALSLEKVKIKCHKSINCYTYEIKRRNLPTKTFCLKNRSYTKLEIIFLRKIPESYPQQTSFCTNFATHSLYIIRIHTKSESTCPSKPHECYPQQTSFRTHTNINQLSHKSLKQATHSHYIFRTHTKIEPTFS